MEVCKPIKRDPQAIPDISWTGITRFFSYKKGGNGLGLVFTPELVTRESEVIYLRTKSTLSFKLFKLFYNDYTITHQAINYLLLFLTVTIADIFGITIVFLCYR